MIDIVYAHLHLIPRLFLTILIASITQRNQTNINAVGYLRFYIILAVFQSYNVNNDVE